MKRQKAITDIVAILCVTTAFVTGINLHVEIHHTYVYNDALMWNLHTIAAIALTLLLVAHGVQHKYWFKNYSKIPVAKKRVATALLCFGAMLLVTGIVLFCGSHSNNVSLAHFFCGIIFAVFAVGHVAKRHHLLTSLPK